MLGGQGQIWFEPLSSIWEGKYFTLLIPVTYALAALLVVARGLLIERMPTRDMDFAVLVACYLASTIFLSLIFHFGFHDAWLSIPFYVVYFVPGCVLALLVLGGEAKRRGGRIFGNAAVLSGAVLILLSWLANPLAAGSDNAVELGLLARCGRGACGRGAHIAPHCRGVCSPRRRRRAGKHVSLSGPLPSANLRRAAPSRSGMGRLSRCDFPSAIRQCQRSHEASHWILVQQANPWNPGNC